MTGEAGPVSHGFAVRSSVEIYRGNIFALRADEVVMPGGGSARREVVAHFGSVAIVPLDEDGRIVLVHQYRHPLGRRLWELPAGLLDEPGEDPAAAASRELAEEAGLAATDWSVLVDSASSPGMTDEVVRVYLARGLSPVARPASGDDEEADLVLRRFPLSEALDMVCAGEIVNGPTVAGVLASRLVQEGAARPRPVDAPWRDRPTRFAGKDTA